MKWPVIGNPFGEKSDNLLTKFLNCPSEREADSLMQKLIEHYAEPIVARTLAKSTRSAEERQDSQSEALIRIVERLNVLRNDRQGRPRYDTKGNQLKPAPPIRNFEGFCRMVARQTLGTILATKNPEWKRLMDRLLFRIDSQNNLCRWKGAGGEMLCGLAAWKQAEPDERCSERLERLADEPDAVAAEAVRKGSPKQISEGELALYLVAWVGGPIEISLLVNAMARIRDLEIQTVPSLRADPDGGPDPDVYEPHSRPGDQVEVIMHQRAGLREHWNRICALPLAERRALLLGASDDRSESVVVLLRNLKVVTYEEMAQALDMTWEEFADLWHRLPLEDNQLAVVMKKTAGYIRVLRSQARKQLRESQSETR